jgi:hypothetical protein
MNFLDTLDSIFTMSSQEPFNITQEQLEEGKKEGARRARMEILSQIDEELRDPIPSQSITPSHM